MKFSIFNLKQDCPTSCGWGLRPVGEAAAGIYRLHIKGLRVVSSLWAVCWLLLGHQLDNLDLKDVSKRSESMVCVEVVECVREKTLVHESGRHYGFMLGEYSIFKT